MGGMIPGQGLTGGTAGVPIGGDGVDDFNCWVAAGIRICSDGGKYNLGRARTYRHCEPQPPIPGTGIGRRRVGRSGARQLRRSRPTCRSRHPIFSRHSISSGFYIGGHTGYGRGSSSAVLSDPLAVSTTGSVFSGVIGGLQGGYNVQMPSGLALGLEADMTFPNYLISNSIVATLTGARSEVVEQLDYVGTVRGRLGYASGHWLVYATGGFAFAGERFINTPDVGPDQKHINVRPGWAAGAGVDMLLRRHTGASSSNQSRDFPVHDERRPRRRA